MPLFWHTLSLFANITSSQQWNWNYISIIFLSLSLSVLSISALLLIPFSFHIRESATRTRQLASDKTARPDQRDISMGGPIYIDDTQYTASRAADHVIIYNIYRLFYRLPILLYTYSPSATLPCLSCQHVFHSLVFSLDILWFGDLRL